MSTQAHTQIKMVPSSSSVPVQTGLLQRKCDCGGSPGVDGECAECREERLTIQRRAINPAIPPEVPPIVHDVLSSPSQPLDVATREFMEPRFGHDFSKVRIHTDAQAAESAQSVNALAFTIGRDVVFGAGQYAPRTNEGRATIAHELTHVVQQSTMSGKGLLTLGPTEDNYEREADAMGSSVMQSTGNYMHSNDTISSAANTTRHFVTPGLNHSFSRVRIQRMPDDPKKKKKPVMAEQDNKSVEDLVKEIVSIVQSDMQKQENDFKAYFQSWKQIEKQIDNPQIGAPKKQKEFSQLYEKELVNDLRKHKKDRAKIREEVLTQLIKQSPSALDCLAFRLLEVLTASEQENKGLTDKLKQLAPKAPSASCVQEEISEFPAYVQKELNEAIDKYPGVREAVKKRFGGRIDKARTYYEHTIVQAFFLGQRAWVHPIMRDKLKKADAALDKWLNKEDQEVKKLRAEVEAERLTTEVAETEQPESKLNVLEAKAKGLEVHVREVREWLNKRHSVLGVQVRANTNREKTAQGEVNLSLHAFGTAIDIDPPLNPNVREFPYSLVEGLTGENIQVKNIKKGQGPGTIKTAFMQKGRFEDILPLVKRLHFVSELFKQVSREAFQNEKSLQHTLETYLRDQGIDMSQDKSDELLSRFKKTYEDEQTLTGKDKAKKKKELRKKFQDNLKKWISSLAVSSVNVGQTAEFLFEAYEVYADTRDETGKFKEIPAQTEGTAATIAVHGFTNIPPELIASLMGEDGGGLKWLGASTVHDFMHFQLREEIDLSAPTKSSGSE